ncbi:DrmB family protein [Streptomyces sp. NPDC059944]|uniref:DrmB family protein n=1 Tax=unclassified Streptomyces TaxID=2593676 RepID=UPI00364FB638
MTSPAAEALRVGELRPSQLLHTYGIGAVTDLPNLSTMVMGLDEWDPVRAGVLTEDRLLAAVRRRLGGQVAALRTPPHLPENPADPYGDWTRTGVPVGLFPRWLRCSRERCNQLAPASGGLFQLRKNLYRPEKTKYVHTNCGGPGKGQPTALPARFLVACPAGHMDDFPWVYFVHRGASSCEGNTLSLTESGTTGEAANVFVRCTCGVQPRSMADALGQAGERNLPACRGHHPHLGTFAPGGCSEHARTMVLGATNSWFASQLRVFSIPRAEEPLTQAVKEHWSLLSPLAAVPADAAKMLLPTQACWPELEQYGADAVWAAVTKEAQAVAGDQGDEDEEFDLITPEWRAFTHPRDHALPDFTTVRERQVPEGTTDWLDSVVLVHRLREVSALTGFTRIEAPEWLPEEEARTLAGAPLSRNSPTWVPCAELRGEGVFLALNEQRLSEWEQQVAVRAREEVLKAAHLDWCMARRVEPRWPGIRYVLLHTLAHVLIRQFALECGYGASGIAERIYARSGPDPMSGILLYTAAPDSEGTLGGLVSLGRGDRLGPAISQALDEARLCSSDPMCAEHDPRIHGRLHGAACHACLFAAETSCERGNHYLDRALLVETLADDKCAFRP